MCNLLNSFLYLTVKFNGVCYEQALQISIDIIIIININGFPFSHAQINSNVQAL